MGTNIPFQLTRFIGRRQEIGDVKRLLAETRLLTLTGPGGSGKTRLAIEVTRQLDTAYSDGVFWVELASIADPALVPKAVAATLSLPEQPGRTVREMLVDFLIEKQLLLILDNCEHLSTACAQLVGSLIKSSPELQVLATSRMPLNIDGEKIFPVSALPFPTTSELEGLQANAAISPELIDNLAGYEAVNLYLDRATAILPGYMLTPDNARSIATICHRLDGMPLAIELAAARANVLTADQIAGLLDNRFTLLTFDQKVGIPQRHQTLRAAIDWSHDFLSLPEQVLLRRLSVFVGGCSLTTAETVCAGEGVTADQMLLLISSLVNKSLVGAETLRRGEARYSLVETIRQYADEKLEAAGEWAAIHDRFLQCYLQVAQETEQKLTGENQESWLNLLADDYDNIRAALSWSLEFDQIEAGLRIAVCLYQFWTIRDYVEEGLTWSERLLARADEGIPLVVRANAFAYASIMAGRRGQIEFQDRFGEQAVVMGEAAGEEGRQGLALALGAQAWSAQKGGDYQRALTIALRGSQLYRELNDSFNLGLILSIFSFSAMSLGDLEQARAMLDEALPLLRQAGNPYRIAMALNYSGDLARCEGDYTRGVSAYEESIPLLREIDAERDLASALHNLGHACLHQGAVERARALFEESMAVHQEQLNTQGTAECLIGFAALAITGNSPAAATRLLAAAVALGGQKITSEWAATRLEYEYYLDRARDGLNENRFIAEQAAGKRLSLKQAVTLAHDVFRKAREEEQNSWQLDELTPREREVASLIAQAKSNGEIAEELVLSKRTVEGHIANILAKLGFAKRAQIVRWAIEIGLVNVSGPDLP